MPFRRAFTTSIFSNSAVVLGRCQANRRTRQRKGSTIRLGNRRRGFWLGPRTVVQWTDVAVGRPFRLLKKIVIGMAADGRLVEAYCWSLSFLRPQLFPSC
ncbi:hypothetical protein CDL12_14459 [Handroanthus impetiginosus]|uniref:Uncharacterized protein n=1 Tax=Handroanthus impetiginosus TaxID=429701 RepID=A0A2G9GN93_9LAMI|nr:hypothetical protein CDL12_20945 [Handroanthus impetiginosus]PIN12934.1 hypothetical protein CDL12_14459 [Handroanthus impetiginosus]